MRTHFNNLARPKAIAKTMAKSLEFLGKKTTLSNCQKIVASMYGYRNWYELSLGISRHGESAPDECVAQSEREKRYEYQRSKLILAGISENHTDYLLKTIRPTACEALVFTKIREFCHHFDEMMNFLEADGYRFHAQGGDQGAVYYRFKRDWKLDPIRRMNIAEKLLEFYPDTGCISAANISGMGFGCDV